MPFIICKICHKYKHVRPHKLKEGKGIFCSLACYNIFKKTPEHKAKIAAWFGAGTAAVKGRPLSMEHRIKISAAHKRGYVEGTFNGFRGHNHTEQEKEVRRNRLLGKPNFSQRGANSHLWKGGITPENHKIRSSLEYKNWRRAVYRRDNWTCVECGRRGGELNADHIKPFALFPKLRFDVRNGRTLCVPCHKKTLSYMHRNIESLRQEYTDA